MKHATVDVEGTLFSVDYTRTDDGVPVFWEVKVLDANYGPIGPNLVHLADKLCLMETENTGDHLLSVMGDQIAEMERVHG